MPVEKKPQETQSTTWEGATQSRWPLAASAGTGPVGGGGTRRDRPGSKGRATVPALAARSPPLVGPEGGPVPLGDQNRDSGTVEVPLVGGPDHFYGVEGDPPADAPTTALRARRGEIDRATTTSRPSEVRDVRRGGRSSRQTGTARPTRRLASLHPNGPSAAARHNALARAFRRRWPLQRRGTNTPRRPGEGVGVGGPRDSRVGATPQQPRELVGRRALLGPRRPSTPSRARAKGEPINLGGGPGADFAETTTEYLAACNFAHDVPLLRDRGQANVNNRRQPRPALYPRSSGGTPKVG